MNSRKARQIRRLVPVSTKPDLRIMKQTEKMAYKQVIIDGEVKLQAYPIKKNTITNLSKFKNRRMKKELNKIRRYNINL
jgi:hypothetical protein